jgi:nucleotide-binding universal stress UspA family protein
VAIDFSPESRQALRQAFALAGDSSRIILLHVVAPTASDNTAEAARILENAREKLKEFCGKANGVSAPKSTQLEVRRGTPFREILECAKERAVEMIVLGVDGSFPLGGVALGHTADRVSRYASCPVLLVRQTNTSVTWARVSKSDTGRPLRDSPYRE